MMTPVPQYPLYAATIGEYDMHKVCNHYLNNVSWVLVYLCVSMCVCEWTLVHFT